MVGEVKGQLSFPISTYTLRAWIAAKPSRSKRWVIMQLQGLLLPFVDSARP